MWLVLVSYVHNGIGDTRAWDVSALYNYRIKYYHNQSQQTFVFDL